MGKFLWNMNICDIWNFEETYLFFFPHEMKSWLSLWKTIKIPQYENSGAWEFVKFSVSGLNWSSTWRVRCTGVMHSFITGLSLSSKRVLLIPEPLPSYTSIAAAGFLMWPACNVTVPIPGLPSRRHEVLPARGTPLDGDVFPRSLIRWLRGNEFSHCT